MRKLLLAASVVPFALVALPAGAANPSGGTVSPASPAVAWSGSADRSNPLVCTGPSDRACDHFSLKVEPEAGKDVRVSIDVAEGQDWDLFVYGPDGDEVDQSVTAGDADESATFAVRSAGTYEVRVQPYAVTRGTTYAGRAELVPAGGGQPVDEETDCPAENVPHQLSPFAIERGEVVSFDIAVLLDGVSQERVADLFERAKPAYEAHGIALQAVSYTPMDSGSGDYDSTDALADAAERFGGMRPANADAVYLATDRELTDENLGDAVAGQVMCVGGVEHPATSFGVGEVKEEAPLTLGPLALDADISLKVLAHELGHLLGAHHHYGNCVEGVGTDDISGDTAPCTLMFNIANFQSMSFSTFNGAVVRGHAVAYADH